MRTHILMRWDMCIATCIVCRHPYVGSGKDGCHIPVTQLSRLMTHFLPDFFTVCLVASAARRSNLITDQGATPQLDIKW